MGGIIVKIGKGEGFIMLSAAGFGIMPVLAKFAYKAGCSVNQVLLYRFLVSALILWAYLFLSGRNFKMGRSKILFLMALGMLGYAATAVAAFTSFEYISAGLADLLLFLYPPIIVVVKRIFFKERISRIGATALILSILGICLIVWTPEMSMNPAGIAAGLLSSVFYSFYVLSLGSSRVRDVDGIVMTAYIVTFCSIGIFLYSIVTGSSVDQPDLNGFIYIILLAAVSTVLPIFLFFLGVKEIGPTKAAIISTVEPAIATSAGAIILGETVSIFTLLGGALIVSGIILLSGRRVRSREEANNS